MVGDAEFGADGCDVFHGAVQYAGEEETDTDLVDAAAGLFGGGGDVDAELFEHVGTAALAGGAAVAVLGDGDPGAGRDKGGGGRDVEGAGMVATCTAGIHQRLAFGVDRGGKGAHGLGKTGDFVDGTALHVDGRKQRGDLGGGGLARHQNTHGLGGFVPRQVLEPDCFRDGFLYGHVMPLDCTQLGKKHG